MSDRIDLEHIKILIDQCGLTYQEIANGSGVSTTTISRIVKGGGAQSGTLTQLYDYLAPVVRPAEPPAPELPPPPDGIPLDVYLTITQRVTDSLNASFAQHLASVNADHAAHMATLRKVARQRLRWIIILAVALVAAIAWFLWDLTHPEMGLIRLKQAGYIIGHLIGLAGR